MFKSENVMLVQLYSKRKSFFLNFLVRKCHSPPQCSPDSSTCDINPEILAARDSEVKRMIQKLEQQTSSVLQGEYVTCVHRCSVFNFIRRARDLDVMKLFFCEGILLLLCTQTTPNSDDKPH